MANIYWNTEKATREDIFAELMKKLPTITDSAFAIRFEEGIAVCVAEKQIDSEISPYKKGHWDIIPSQVLGWRIIKKVVPKGYIDVFYYEA